MDLNLIKTFVAVCEEGGVTAAAVKMGLPKSTVSRHLARLEDSLEAALLDRDAAGFRLTPYGRRLFEDARSAIHSLEPLERRHRKNASPMAGFAIAVPRFFATGVLKPILLDYLAAHPEQKIEVIHGDRLSEDHAEKADLQILVGTRFSQAGTERELMTVEARLYASPALVEEFTLPDTPSDLASWPCLSMCTVAGVPERLTLENSKGKSVTVSMQTRLASNELDLLTDAACRGLGIVQLPCFVGDRLVEEGQLVRILPEYRTDRFLVTMAMAARNRNAAARNFADYLFQALN